MNTAAYRPDQLWEISTRRIGVTVGVLLALYGIAIGIAQTVAWLKSGTWSPVSVAMFFIIPPGVEPELPLPYSLIPTWFFSERFASYLVEAGPNAWLGLRAIALWLLNLPLSLVWFAAGMWLVATQLSGLNRLDEERRRASPLT